MHQKYKKLTKFLIKKLKEVSLSMCKHLNPKCISITANWKSSNDLKSGVLHSFPPNND